MRSTSRPAAPSLVRRALVAACSAAAELGAATFATPAAARRGGAKLDGGRNA